MLLYAIHVLRYILRNALTATQLEVLERNLKDVGHRDSIANDIKNMVDNKQSTHRGKDRLTQTTGRKVYARSIRFIMSTKDLVLAVSRLDKHGVAPIVLTGVYTLVTVLQNENEEAQTALMTGLEVAGIVGLWTSIEKNQILKNQNERLTTQYKKLSALIIELYEGIIVLLGTMMGYYDKSRLRKYFRCLKVSTLTIV